MPGPRGPYRMLTIDQRDSVFDALFAVDGRIELQSLLEEPFGFYKSALLRINNRKIG